MKWMVWMMLQPSATYPQPNKNRSTWEEVNLLNLLGDPTGNRTPVSGVRGREAPNAHKGFHNNFNMFVLVCHRLYPCVLMFFTHGLHIKYRCVLLTKWQ